MQIRQPSEPDQSYSGKSGSLLSLINPAQANQAPVPSLINPAQANQAIRQTKKLVRSVAWGQAKKFEVPMSGILI